MLFSLNSTVYSKYIEVNKEINNGPLQVPKKNFLIYIYILSIPPEGPRGLTQSEYISQWRPFINTNNTQGGKWGEKVKIKLSRGPGKRMARKNMTPSDNGF